PAGLPGLAAQGLEYALLLRSEAMPSFDVVSEVDKHEARNAVEQARRELSTRFDFRGVDASFEQNDLEVTMTANHKFQIEQMKSMLTGAMTKRGIKVNCLEYSKPEGTGKLVRVKAKMRSEEHTSELQSRE